jgi:PKHD-type hydroxylase
MTLLLEPVWKSYIVTTIKPILTPKQCDDVIRMGQSQPSTAAGIALGKAGDNKRSGIDKKKRITMVSWLPFNLAKPMYKIIERWMLNTNANRFGFDDMQITERGQYTEYTKGGFYDWHVDSSFEMSATPPVRKISMTLLLSDPKDFKGGEFEIITDKQPIKLQRGYAVFFASFISHQVKPIIKGNRKSLVMWFGGAPFK